MKANSKIPSILRQWLLASILLIGSSALHAISITSKFTGAWYDPALNGTGFSIEVIDSNTGPRLLIYWFTFDPDGSPLWLVGLGDFDKSTSTVELYQVTGGVFPGVFENMDTLYWGDITLDFSDCNNARFQWSPASTTKEQFGTGFSITKRISQVYATKCTGGVSDDVQGDSPVVKIIDFLLPPQSGAANGQTKYEQRPDRTEFSVTVNDLPLGAYDVVVAGQILGSIDVLDTPVGTSGELLFRSPVESGKTLLDFDPRGQTIEIRAGNNALLSSTLPATDNTDEPVPGSPPPFGNAEYSVHMTSDVYPDAFGKAELELRADRVEFDIEANNLPEGSYEVHAAGELRGVITVVNTSNGSYGEIEFRFPVESDNELLDFDPRDAVVEIRTSDGIVGVVLSGFLPDIPTDDFGDDGDDGDDGGDNDDGDDDDDDDGDDGGDDSGDGG